MSRSRTQPRSRKENTRDERKVTQNRELMTFSFKYFDATQPEKNPETLELWDNKKLLKLLVTRLVELSKLTRDEAINQTQIKIYGDFPTADITDFFHPKHVEENVPWSVIEGIGGKPRVAGFISESTFYVVFLDSEHRFWVSTKKHT